MSLVFKEYGEHGYVHSITEISSGEIVGYTQICRICVPKMACLKYVPEPEIEPLDSRQIIDIADFLDRYNRMHNRGVHIK